MEWVGDSNRVEDALRAHSAKQDEEGNYLIRGGSIVSFMGAGEELCVSDGVEILSKKGDKEEWVPLVPLLYGGSRVTVIGA